RPVVTFDDGAQHLRLALGTVKLGRLAEPLDCADLLCAPSAVGDQRLNLRIDRVDALAQPPQRRFLFFVLVSHPDPLCVPMKIGAIPRTPAAYAPTARR